MKSMLLSVLLLTVPLCGVKAENKMANPGFEPPLGTIDAFGSNGNTGVNSGWNYQFPDTESYIWSEAGQPCSRGCPQVRTGVDALRCHTSGNGSMMVWQDIAAAANAPHRASVYASGVDFVIGEGFGSSPTDSAGMWIQELDAGDNLLVDHGKIAITTPTPYTLLTSEFTTTSSTAKIRYMLHTKMVCPYTHGHVTYDDCVLDALPVPDDMEGIVTSGGTAIKGATLAVGSKTGSTNATGFYSISIADMAAGETVTVRASKDSHFAQRKTRVISGGTNTVDFDLVGKGNNLLLNAGFDDGWNAGWSTELGSVGVPRVEPETNTAVWTSAVYYHSGEQAVFIANDYGGDAKVYQSVPVQPGTQYEAAAMFKAAWKPGLTTAWGVNPSQKAGLYVAEYDSSGALIVEHPVVWATDFANWQRLSLTFTTSVNAATVRVGGYANLVDDYTLNLGRAVFDSLELNGPSVGIGSVKNLADGAAISLTDKAVTAVFDGFFYIEEMDRSSGIRVSGSAAVGDAVSISGSISTIDGEKVVVPNTLIIGGSTHVPGPLGMTLRCTGEGLSPLGLYVTTWGTVDQYGGNVFTISDGSRSLKVYGMDGYVADPGDYVSVTGALGAELSGSDVVGVMRAVSVREIRKAFMYGVNTHSDGYGYIGVPQTTQLDLTEQLGAKWVRWDWSQTALQANPGYYIAWVDAAAARGIRIAPAFGPTVAYNMAFNDPSATLQDIYNAAYQFGQSVATQFRNRVRYYELGNEYEGSCFIVETDGSCASDFDLSKSLRAFEIYKGMHQGMKDVNPYAQTVINIGGWFHYGFTDLMETHGVDYDILAWHWYSLDSGTVTAVPHIPSCGAEYVNPDGTTYNLLAKLRSYGKPVWFNEVNRAGGNMGSNGDAEQVQWINTFVPHLAQSQGVGGVWIYELLDEPMDDQNSQEAHYGLVSRAQDQFGVWSITTPKPAFYAYQSSIVNVLK